MPPLRPYLTRHISRRTGVHPAPLGKPCKPCYTYACTLRLLPLFMFFYNFVKTFYIFVKNWNVVICANCVQKYTLFKILYNLKGYIWTLKSPPGR